MKRVSGAWRSCSCSNNPNLLPSVCGISSKHLSISGISRLYIDIDRE